MVHSLMAREGVKAQLKPVFGVYYRLAYNLFASVQIAFVYGFGYWLYAGFASFDLPHWVGMVQTGIYIFGWVMMIFALREYDLGTLSGLKQIRERTETDDEPLHFVGFHRWVRHPLYSAGFMILWGRVGDEFSFMTAVCGSLYLWIGCFFEERQLIRLYGNAYRNYKSKVPAFVPYKGRVDLKEGNA